ncbi:MAG: hypothetical protein QGG48_08115, partial [Desulfatiglandales bacterium]|nr:hypothetical protein [Desulfatiglandales bacterium]
LEVLEKTGKLGKMRKILEAGGYAAQFKASPFPHTLESFGSPIYGMNRAPVVSISTRPMKSSNFFGIFWILWHPAYL